MFIFRSMGKVLIVHQLTIPVFIDPTPFTVYIHSGQVADSHRVQVGESIGNFYGFKVVDVDLSLIHI